MNDQQRAAMIRPRGKSEAPHMVAAYRAMQMALEALELLKAFLPYPKPNTVQSPYHLSEEAITALREALAQPQGEPVAWRVTGPFEDVPFKDRSSAEAYRKGLNDGYGSDAYSVSPLYTTPPSVEAAIEATKEKAAKVCEELWANDNHNAVSGADVCAAAIRSMK